MEVRVPFPYELYFSMNCVVYNVKFALRSMHCKICTVKSALCYMHCVFTYALHSMPYALCSVHFVEYTLKYGVCFTSHLFKELHCSPLMHMTHLNHNYQDLPINSKRHTHTFLTAIMILEYIYQSLELNQNFLFKYWLVRFNTYLCIYVYLCFCILGSE